MNCMMLITYQTILRSFCGCANNYQPALYLRTFLFSRALFIIICNGDFHETSIKITRRDTGDLLHVTECFPLFFTIQGGSHGLLLLPEDSSTILSINIYLFFLLEVSAFAQLLKRCFNFSNYRPITQQFAI